LKPAKELAEKTFVDEHGKPIEAKRYGVEVALLPSIENATGAIEIAIEGEPIEVKRPLTYEFIIGLPGELIEEWMGAILELNKVWDETRSISSKSIEKKVPTSTND